jgi:signal peptidase II
MFYWLTILLMLFDQGTKLWIASHLALREKITVIPEWLSWHLIHNEGATFGLFSGFTFVITGISFVVILYVLYLYRKNESKTMAVQWEFALLIGGALGNLIDRVWLGYVVDFIDFRWWPAIFNVADVEIRGGILLLLYLYIRN